MSFSIRIKNMMCNCCIELLKIKLAVAGIQYERIELGKAVFPGTNDEQTISAICNIIEPLGMAIIEDKESNIIEIAKHAVFDMIHRMNNLNTIIKKSEYLVEKTGTNYQTLSKLFSKHTGTTLERYIILNKIERIKELIENEEYTLSEIAYMMDYSSVHYLSSQFKKETGYTVSEYKKLEIKPRTDLNMLT